MSNGKVGFHLAGIGLDRIGSDQIYLIEATSDQADRNKRTNKIILQLNFSNSNLHQSQSHCESETRLLKSFPLRFELTIRVNCIISTLFLD